MKLRSIAIGMIAASLAFSSCQPEEVPVSSSNLFDRLNEGTWQGKVLFSGVDESSQLSTVIIEAVLETLHRDIALLKESGYVPKGYSISYTLSIHQDQIILENANYVALPSSTRSTTQGKAEEDFSYFVCGLDVVGTENCPDIACLSLVLQFAAANQCTAGSVEVFDKGDQGFYICYYDVSC
ncbi:MAG: hypothetical protein AAFQ98_06250 [Bacteroidota bacterium]